MKKLSITKPLGIIKNYWKKNGLIRDLRTGVLGRHVEFDRVHEDHRKNVEILDDVETAYHPVNHLAHTGFIVKNFTDTDMPVLFLQSWRLGMHPGAHLFGVRERVLLGDIIRVFLLRLGDHTVLIYHFQDRKIFPVMILGNRCPNGYLSQSFIPAFLNYVTSRSQYRVCEQVVTFLNRQLQSNGIYHGYTFLYKILNFLKKINKKNRLIRSIHSLLRLFKSILNIYSTY